MGITEYSGLVMGKHHKSTEGQTVCVDIERAVHKRSEKKKEGGGILKTTEMHQGSADEIYPNYREISCALCSADIAQIDATEPYVVPERGETDPGADPGNETNPGNETDSDG